MFVAGICLLIRLENDNDGYDNFDFVAIGELDGDLLLLLVSNLLSNLLLLSDLLFCLFCL